MTSLTADWRRHNAIVIGYPANKGLIRFYVECCDFFSDHILTGQ